MSKPAVALRLVALFAVAGLVASCGGQNGSQDPFEPCDLPGVGGRVMCGTVPVAEDRGDADSRTIDLYVVVAKAHATHSAVKDPIFFFAGGPGDSAGTFATHMIGPWEGLRHDRDLVFIDQRGTGRSNALFCDFLGPPDKLQTYVVDMFPIDELPACREQGAHKAKLEKYTTTESIHDFDAVRRRLGYEKINLVGYSYGTRVVLEYLRRYPQTIRAAVLRGPLPTYAHVPTGMARDTERALDHLFQDCAEDAACSANFPTLKADLLQFLSAIPEDGLRGPAARPDGGIEEVVVPYGLFVSWIRSQLYSVERTARLPAAIKQMAQGDLKEVLTAVVNWRRVMSEELADGMYLSVICAEDLPYFDLASELEAARGTMIDDYRARQQSDACQVWVQGDVPEDFHDPVTVDVPVLILTGEVDPSTPLRFARSLARDLPNALSIEVPNRSHGLRWKWADCLGPLTDRFLRTGGRAPLDHGCVKGLTRPPFELPDSAPASTGQ